MQVQLKSGRGSSIYDFPVHSMAQSGHEMILKEKLSEVWISQEVGNIIVILVYF